MKTLLTEQSQKLIELLLMEPKIAEAVFMDVTGLIATTSLTSILYVIIDAFALRELELLHSDFTNSFTSNVAC